MKDFLLLNVKKFLNSQRVSTQPLLIGYSGGPDSKVLLYLLMECRRFFSLELHVAHLDHGWRKQSADEAQKIQKEVEDLGLIFHLKSLSSKDFSLGNTEEQGREHRLSYFAQIYSQIDAQALLLGHQADDRAETVLKRVFEGASLFSLGGFGMQTMLRGMNVWRPLLFVRKKDILHWLDKKQLSYFLDETNHETRFLRGKMREEMFPLLTASFGKEISANLCRLGDESKEIKEYFHNLNRPILATIQKQDPWDLDPYLPMPLIQLKYLLKECLDQEGLTVSGQIIHKMALGLNERLAKKKFCSKKGEFHIDKGRVYFYKNKL